MTTDLKPGSSDGALTYADGHPHDRVQFFDAKLILKPDFFYSVRGFKSFSDLVTEAVSEVKGVRYEAFDLAKDAAAHSRGDVRRYRRLPALQQFLYSATPYRVSGRLSDRRPRGRLQVSQPGLGSGRLGRRAAQIAGPYRIKFKSEALPLKDQAGGFRLLYSHNCIFPVSSVHSADRTNLKTYRESAAGGRRAVGEMEGSVELVNSTLVEEVLMDLGTIDFGKGMVAKSNISLWRSLGDHQVMCGEFAYQTKFDRREDVHELVKQRVEELFIKLQLIATGLALSWVRRRPVSSIA